MNIYMRCVCPEYRKNYVSIQMILVLFVLVKAIWMVEELWMVIKRNA